MRFYACGLVFVVLWFGGDRAIPAPRPSESGRRRSSRRTVRIPDDRVLRGEGTPTPAAAGTEPVSNTPRPAPAGYAEFLEEATDEITIVRPHRIISVGDSSAPPAPTKAQATWPPPTRPATPAFGTNPVPPVAPVAMPATAAPLVAPRRSPTGEHAEPRSDRQPPPMPSVSQPLPMPAAPTFGAPPAPVVAVQAPIAAPPIAAPPVAAPPVAAPAAPSLDSDTLEIDRSEFVEVVEAPPKRPPPPKARGARAEGRGAEPKPVDAPKGKPWWEDLWKGDAIRTFEPLDALTVKREVDFLEESLGVRKGARVLDLACGFGEHALEFAARDYDLVGFDLSRDMLAVAEQGARARSEMEGGRVGLKLGHGVSIRSWRRAWARSDSASSCRAWRPARTCGRPATQTSLMALRRWLAKTCADSMASALGRPCSSGLLASSTTQSACWPTASPAIARALACAPSWTICAATCMRRLSSLAPSTPGSTSP
jgi:hypothetical protein